MIAAVREEEIGLGDRAMWQGVDAAVVKAAENELFYNRRLEVNVRASIPITGVDVRG